VTNEHLFGGGVGLFPQTQGGCDRRDQQVRIGERCERNEGNTSGKSVDHFCSRLQPKPGLSAPTRPRQRHDPRTLTFEQLRHLLQVSIATKERCWLHGKVRLVETFQGREVALAELIDAFSGLKVFQAMEAEIPDFRFDEAARCF